MPMTSISIEREMEFMIKYGLTPDEMYLIQLIFMAQNDHPEYLNRFYSQGEFTTDLRQTLQSVQNKGIINKSYKIPSKGNVFNPADVDFNKSVLKTYMQHSQDLGMELFMAYPSTTTINNRVFSLRNIAKVYSSMDDFCFAYGKIIKFNPEKHKEIMDILEYAKENNLIKSGIVDFVISMKWLDYAEMKQHAISEIDNIELL